MAWLTDAVRRLEKADARLSSIELRMARIRASSGAITSLRRYAAARCESSRRAALVRLMGEIEMASDRRFEERGIATGLLPVIAHSARRFSEFADRCQGVAKRYRLDGKLDGIVELLDDMDSHDTATRRSLVAILHDLGGAPGNDVLPRSVSVALAFRNCMERGGESLVDPFITFFGAAMRRRANDRANIAWRIREELIAGMDPAATAAIRRVRERMIPADTA